MDNEQLQYPFDRQVEVRCNVELPGSGTADLVYLDGELVPRQTSLTIDSDMDFRHLEFAVLHMPSVQEIVVSGYVVPAGLLNWYAARKGHYDTYEEFEPGGFGGYLIEEGMMKRLADELNEAPLEEVGTLRAQAGVPGPLAKLRVGV